MHTLRCTRHSIIPGATCTAATYLHGAELVPQAACDVGALNLRPAVQSQGHAVHIVTMASSTHSHKGMQYTQSHGHAVHSHTGVQYTQSQGHGDSHAMYYDCCTFIGD